MTEVRTRRRLAAILAAVSEKFRTSRPLSSVSQRLPIRLERRGSLLFVPAGLINLYLMVWREAVGRIDGIFIDLLATERRTHAVVMLNSQKVETGLIDKVIVAILIAAQLFHTSGWLT